MPAVGWTLRASAGTVIEAAGIPAAISRGLHGAASVLDAGWKEHLRQPGRGRRYDHYLRTFFRGDGSAFVAPVEPRVPHTASRPGDSPAPDLGASGGLLGSISVEQIDPRTVRVGTDKPYARYLRDGVYDHPAGIVIEPRQVEPDIKALEPAMTAEMVRALAPVGVRVA